MKRLLGSILALTVLLSASAAAFVFREEPAGFSDVNTSTEYANAVAYMYENDIMSRVGSATFGFSDVDASAEYADAVYYMYENGIMSGTGSTTFSPNETMSRAMLATVLYRSAGTPEVSGEDRFTDTEPGAWYSDAVLWASQKGLLTGYGNGLFGTDNPVTREQIVAILWRYAGQPEAGEADVFADASSISAYAQKAVNWARSNRIVSVTSENRFDPRSSVTRAEIAVILHNYLTMGQNTPPENDQEGPRILIAYFSRVGNTDFSGHVDAVTSASINVRNGDHVGNNQLVAEAIHSLVGGELMEIKAEAPYPSDYDETVAQNQQEQRNGTMPAISTTISADNYDIIFVGYPVWATTLPAPVKTFLTQNGFSGKMIVPFCTHAGYGAGRSGAVIQELCPDAQVRSVLAVDDDELEQADSLVASWLEELNIPETSSGLSPEQTQMITLTIGEEVITAELNNTPAAQEFARSLPITVSMTRMGEHEYYGALSEPLSENGNTLQTGYTVGDLAFWTPGDLFAFYFDEPETPPQGLIILGHIRSDLSVFDRTGNRESVRIELLPS